MARINLQRLRKRLGYSQVEMAAKMGLSHRAYHGLEVDPGTINIRHIMLARMVSLMEAVERGDRALAEPDVADLADRFSHLPR